MNNIDIEETRPVLLTFCFNHFANHHDDSLARPYNTYIPIDRSDLRWMLSVRAIDTVRFPLDVGTQSVIPGPRTPLSTSLLARPKHQETLATQLFGS